MIAVTIFEARRCSWNPRKYFTGVFSNIIGRKRQCMSWKSNPLQLISDLALLSGKNWLNLGVIEVFISIINKIIPECNIISAPPLLEYSRIYNNLIDKIKLWKKQDVKTFGFIVNATLDRCGVVMASSVVSGNHCFCVRVNLETGDVLYADSIGREVPSNFGKTFSNFFQAIYEVYKKNFIKFVHVAYKIQWTKSAHKCEYFKFINQRNEMIGCNIFCNYDVWFYNSYKNYSKTKNDPLLRLNEWLRII